MKRRLHLLTAASILTLGLFIATGCSQDDRPLTLAPQVDLDRYAGRWYIIANIPYFAEKGSVGSYFDISFQPGQKFKDVYVYRTATFDAPLKSFTMNGYVVPDTGNARWRESPFWPLYLSYLILYVDPDYQYALVGYPGRGYGWVLSRRPDITEDVYKSLLSRFEAQGYDTTLFRRVPQNPAQIGSPGFQ
jgi:apolipoprotein D and lipocalin family protein